MTAPLNYSWYVLVFGLLGGMSFVFFPGNLDPVHLPQSVLLAALSAVGIGLLIWGERKEKQPRRISLPKALTIGIGGYVLMHLVALSGAISLPEALFETLKSLTGLAVAWLALWHFGAPGADFGRLARIVLVIAGLQALVGLLQYTDIAFTSVPGGTAPPYGTHANANLFASALALSLPFGLYTALTAQGAWRWVGIGGSLLLLALIVLSLSRAMVLGTLLCILIFVPVYALRHFQRRKQVRNLLLGGLVLSIPLLWFATYPIVGQKAASHKYDLLWKEDVRIQPSTNSLEFRYIVWNRTMDMAADHWLTGVGPGNFKTNIQRYGIQGFDHEGRYGMHYALRAHNDFLGKAAELGLPGLCFLLLILFTAFRGGTRWLRQPGRAAWLRGWAVLLGLTYFCIAASFSFPTERPHQSAMFWLLVVLAVAPPPGTEASARRASIVLPRAVPYVLLALTAFATVFFALRTTADRDMLRVKEAQVRQQWPKVLKLLPLRAAWTYPLESASGIPVKWYEAIARLQSGDAARGLTDMEAALEAAPWNIATRANHAGALSLNQRNADAKAAYVSLLETFPDFEEQWLNLAIVHLQLGDVNAAQNALAQAPSWQGTTKYQQVQQALSTVPATNR